MTIIASPVIAAKLFSRVRGWVGLFVQLLQSLQSRSAFHRVLVPLGLAGWVLARLQRGSCVFLRGRHEWRADLASCIRLGHGWRPRLILLRNVGCVPGRLTEAPVLRLDLVGERMLAWSQARA